MATWCGHAATRQHGNTTPRQWHLGELRCKDHSVPLHEVQEPRGRLALQLDLHDDVGEVDGGRGTSNRPVRHRLLRVGRLHCPGRAVHFALHGQVQVQRHSDAVARGTLEGHPPVRRPASGEVARASRAVPAHIRKAQ